MSDLSQIATCEDEASAESLAGLLRSEGVPSFVRPVSPIPGLIDEVQIRVPTSLAHRARWLMKSLQVTDVELRFAATGELTRDEE